MAAAGALDLPQLAASGKTRSGNEKAATGRTAAAFGFAEGSSTNENSRRCRRLFMRRHRVEEISSLTRSWQDWQRPTLPSLET